MIVVLQRELVLLPYPFSDLKSAKVRPAVVISNNKYNREFEDMLVVPVTSNLSLRKFVVQLSGNRLETGHLIADSVVKADRVLSVKQNMTIKSIGKVKKEVLAEITDSIKELIKEY